ncbi:transmembrane protein 272-like [Branchiostoma lanceolatum]|uniref:transmembrane protein 272-like n=1 Tax=Branchiostoma lanceolatum TaxID=7740 RepID=UPI003456AA00
MEVFTCKNASRLLSFLIILCMIIIGGVYRESCPINFLIPIYLIVYGVFLLVPTIGSIVHGRQDQDEAGEPEGGAGGQFGPDQIMKSPVFSCVQGVVGCFLFGWFIAGNVWVYSAYPVVDRNNSTSPEYCHFVLYDFAFTITTLVWITLALGLCAGVITVVCSVGKDGEDMS